MFLVMARTLRRTAQNLYQYAEISIRAYVHLVRLVILRKSVGPGLGLRDLGRLGFSVI